eukprot:GAHX01000724.1.p1 GENE.GAHX01000724.1~~GAHX01000724.1.p1  ORF type:complete len:187 (-),score=23.91 GAHX01000724.1:252-812(-)
MSYRALLVAILSVFASTSIPDDFTVGIEKNDIYFSFFEYNSKYSYRSIDFKITVIDCREQNNRATARKTYYSFGSDDEHKVEVPSRAVLEYTLKVRLDMETELKSLIKSHWGKSGTEFAKGIKGISNGIEKSTQSRYREFESDSESLKNTDTVKFKFNSSFTTSYYLKVTLKFNLIQTPTGKLVGF